jgi:hypothetical protein
VKKLRLKKEPFYKERCEEERKQFDEELAEISEETDVVYVDEAGVCKEMNPVRGRAKRGVKLYQETTGKRTKKDNVIAGFCNGLMLALTVFAWTTDTQWFCFWFEYSLIPLLKPNSVVVLDNASFHSKTYLPIIAEAYGHRVLWLPKYSPDKNLIENEWGSMKTWLRNYSKHYPSIRDAIHYRFR